LRLDDIVLKKGQRDFVVLVTSRQANGQLKRLGVLPDRLLENVKQFLLAIPQRLQTTVREVCIDMYEAYTSAVKKALSQARIVADRFHKVGAHSGYFTYDCSRVCTAAQDSAEAVLWLLPGCAEVIEEKRSIQFFPMTNLKLQMENEK
jgi:transposase